MTDYPGTHWGEAPCASNWNLLEKLPSADGLNAYNRLPLHLPQIEEPGAEIAPQIFNRQACVH